MVGRINRFPNATMFHPNITDDRGKKLPLGTRYSMVRATAGYELQGSDHEKLLEALGSTRRYLSPVSAALMLVGFAGVAIVGVVTSSKMLIALGGVWFIVSLILHLRRGGPPITLANWPHIKTVMLRLKRCPACGYSLNPATGSAWSVCSECGGYWILETISSVLSADETKE